MTNARMAYVPKPEAHFRPMGFSPHGLLMLQSWEQVGLYFRALDKYRVNLFVEIGVADGGLREFITPRAAIMDGFSYLGCELVKEPLEFMRPSNSVRNCTTFIGDCFSPEFADILRRKMATSSVTFLLCDGGDKPREAAYFSKLMRKGDYLAVHDYTDEVQDADLACLGDKWQEVEPELYRAALVPLFQRVR